MTSTRKLATPSANSTLDQPRPAQVSYPAAYDHQRRMAELSVADLSIATTDAGNVIPLQGPHPAVYGLVAAVLSAMTVAVLSLAMRVVLA